MDWKSLDEKLTRLPLRLLRVSPILGLIFSLAILYFAFMFLLFVYRVFRRRQAMNRVETAQRIEVMKEHDDKFDRFINQLDQIEDVFRDSIAQKYEEGPIFFTGVKRAGYLMSEIRNPVAFDLDDTLRREGLNYTVPGKMDFFCRRTVEIGQKAFAYNPQDPEAVSEIRQDAMELYNTLQELQEVLGALRRKNNKSMRGTAG